MSSVESKCPYCAHTLEKKPLRKKKCPNCGNYMYVRSTPTGQTKVLVTEQQAAEIEKEWEAYHQEKMLGSDSEYRHEYEQIKAQLTAKRGAEPSAGDIRWSLANKRLLRYMTTGDWGLYRNTKMDMAQQLEGEHKLKQALRTYLEVCYLDVNGPCSNSSDSTAFDPEQGFIAPGIIWEVGELGRSLGLQPDELESPFLEVAEANHKRMRLPIDPATAWDQIQVELRAAAKDEIIATQPQPQPKKEIFCPQCGTALLSQAKFCEQCGVRMGDYTPPDDTNFCAACDTSTSRRNIEMPEWDYLPRRAQGSDGKLVLLGDRVRISRKGLWPRTGDKEILLSQISAVQFTKAGRFMPGRIQFSFRGGGESKLGTGIDSANTVMFNSMQELDFVAIKEEIDERIATLHAAPKASSSLDDLEKLASLRDKGIITEEEFRQKKKHILGL